MVSFLSQADSAVQGLYCNFTGKITLVGVEQEPVLAKLPGQGQGIGWFDRRSFTITQHVG